MPTPPVSSKKASFSSGKYRPQSPISKRLRAMEFSDILTMARLPAAKAEARGMKLRLIGKFQGTMIPVTPSGWGMTRFLPPKNMLWSTWRFCTFIHFFRCLIQSLMPSVTEMISANWDSCRERLP